MAHMMVTNESQQVSDWLAPGPQMVNGLDLWLDDDLPYANMLRGQTPTAVAATGVGLWVRTPNNAQQQYLIPWSRVTAATLSTSG